MEQTSQITTAVSTPELIPQTLNIEINFLQGIIVIAATLIGLGVTWGALKKAVASIEKTIDTDIKPDLKNLRERFSRLEIKFSSIETKVDTLWKDRIAPAKSPRQLNSLGQSILETSGIKKIVDEKKDKLLAIVQQAQPTNPYDAEKYINDTMINLPKHCPEIIDQLKLGAFKSGVDINEVLFVGSIYLRNLIFSQLGFNVKDLDDSNHSKPSGPTELLQG